MPLRAASPACMLALLSLPVLPLSAAVVAPQAGAAWSLDTQAMPVAGRAPGNGGGSRFGEARGYVLQKADPDASNAAGGGPEGDPSGAQSGADGQQRPDAAGSRRMEPFPGVAVLPGVPSVELRAWVCLEAGWLEQVACSPGTREHEALVVPEAAPSRIHAALLMAGFEPGHPGSWSLTPEGEFLFTPPQGSALDVLVRYQRKHVLVPAGIMRGIMLPIELPAEEIEEPISAWIRDHHGVNEFPDAPWVFAGSSFEEMPDEFGGGEYYLADASGSIVGLVTFGDEVVGFSRVISDDAGVQPPEWEVNRDRVPPVGTEVTVILRAPSETGETTIERP